MPGQRLGAHQQAIAEHNVDAILDATEELLGQLVQASISAVAKLAGVSRVTVYSHFPTWQALLEAAVERAVRRTMAAVRAANPGEALRSRRWSAWSARPGGTWPVRAPWPGRWPSSSA